jgi:hypothetical protein
MTNKSKTFLFGWTVVVCIIAVAIIPMFIGGCLANSEPIHYYKIQRLNINGEVMQTYYSKSYPWGTDYIDFREYPSGKWIKLKCSYTAEDLGTNKPSL